MMKRFLVLLLAATLLLGAVSCRREPDPGGEDDPSAQETEGGLTLDPSDTGGNGNNGGNNGETGTEPSVKPIPPVNYAPVASLIDGFTLNDQPYFGASGNVSELLTAAGNRITVDELTDAVSLCLSGWIGFEQAIDSFGYQVDSEASVLGNFSCPADESILTQGGQYAQRFSILVPLFNLKPGSHTVSFVARLSDGTVVRVHDEITVMLEGLTVNTGIPFYSSVTHVNGGNAYKDRGGNTEKGVDVIDGKADGKTVSADCSLTFSGWMAVSGGVERYVWSVNGIDWHATESTGKNGEPSAGHFASLGFDNANHGAILTNLRINLSPYDDQTVDVTLGAVPVSAPDQVVPFVTVTGLYVPDLPNDISYFFESDVTCNPEGTDFYASDLYDCFQINYGAGDLHSVGSFDDALCYNYAGIHEMYAVVDGRYALSADIKSMDGTAYLFVRGYHTVTSDDLLANLDPAQGRYYIGNYFETDGAGAMGGAGIYAGLQKGKLTVLIKYYDKNNLTRIGNDITQIPCKGETLTMVDNGKKVFILVDGKIYATVSLSGSVSYPDINDVSPKRPFAATATLSVTGGTTKTIKNTLVAASCSAQCGLTLRGGEIHFTSISLTPLAESEFDLQ